MNTKKIINISMALLLFAITAAADTQVRRYLLSAGANNGGKDRVVLRYAVSDAKAFASVLTDMGGVEKNDAMVLSNPTRRELLSGIGSLGKRIAGSDIGSNVRSEVFVYYSGHADEDGLKLSGETLHWAEFRKAVNGLDADVRVAVLDACGSGAITRTKGGVARPAFLSDASMNMKGYAFLTSSNENEASQESDRIKGSYFTHALLSGLRGAADMTGDGRVTINEAYQYAFNETLQSTQNTRAGTQHPSRDMNLAGTGDVVMTDLRRTSATLSLDADTEGRLFIRDEQENLFAELRKTRGRPVELGIPPGKYTVQMETPKGWAAGDVIVNDGSKTVLAMSGMKPMGARRRTVARGEGRTGVASVYDRAVIDLTAYADVSDDMAISLRTGIPWVYALFEYNQKAGWFDRWPKGYGLGLGTNFGMSGRFAVDLDLVWSVVRTESYYRDMRDHKNDSSGDDDWDWGHKNDFWFNSNYKARVGVSYSLLPYLAATGGVSVNGNLECKHTDTWKRSKRFGSVYSGEDARGHRYHAWPGLYAGVTIGKINTVKRGK